MPPRPSRCPAGAPPGSAGAPACRATCPMTRSLFLKACITRWRSCRETHGHGRWPTRVGHFAHVVQRLRRRPGAHAQGLSSIARWRLEKKDPAAALSEPVKPITYWIDRTVPPKYRRSRRDHRRHPGVEQGLRAHRLQERRGGEGAARQRRLRHAGLRRGLGALDAQFEPAVRRHRAAACRSAHRRDPGRRHQLREPVVAQPAQPRRASFRPPARRPGRGCCRSARRPRRWPRTRAGRGRRPRPMRCDHAGPSPAEQLDFGLDVLEARGELDPDGPEAEQFVQAYLKDVAMHEVGHAGPAAQLPRLADLPRRRSPTRSSPAEERPSPAR